MFEDRESELSNALKQAIDDIKSDPVPESHMHRALHRARIVADGAYSPDLMRYLLILGGCVAAVLVSVVIFPVIITLVTPQPKPKNKDVPKFEYKIKHDDKSSGQESTH